MKKLKQPRINQLCRDMNVGRLSVCRIAKHAGVSPRWTREIYGRYLELGRPPVLGKCGRPTTPTPLALREKIKQEYADLPAGALEMEHRFLRSGIVLSHNRIHVVLREEKLAKREPKKSRKRKWVRYERHKFNSLLHADWKLLQGKHLILFEDDATRFVVGYGLFDFETAELSLCVFLAATKKWGMPRQLLTDNGSVFCNTHDKKDMEHEFHGAVVKAGCDHIFTRPSHPQCNGKLEKLNDTIQKLYKHYDGDLDKAVKAYNEKRLHMSLDWQTPQEAKQAKEQKGLVYVKPTKTTRGT
jgi:transposase InsO family protein